jgi:hypothetical protein
MQQSHSSRSVCRGKGGLVQETGISISFHHKATTHFIYPYARTGAPILVGKKHPIFRLQTNNNFDQHHNRPSVPVFAKCPCLDRCYYELFYRNALTNTKASFTSLHWSITIEPTFRDDSHLPPISNIPSTRSNLVSGPKQK